MQFNTAGGATDANSMLPMRIPELGDTDAAVANAYILDDTPGVISVGKRVNLGGGNRASYG